MQYLSNADRKIYASFTAWTPRPLNKSEKLIARIAEANAYARSLSGRVRDIDDPAEQKMIREQMGLADEIHAAFNYMFERRNLAIRALLDQEALAELVALYPNVGVTQLYANKPTTGLLGLALAGHDEHTYAAAQAWFDKMVGALSLVHKLPDYYLVYSGVGPAKPLIHRSAIETKNPLLYGMTVPAAAQKSFIELFNVREHANLRLILDYNLHQDPTFTKGTELAIAPRQLEGFLKNHNVLDFDYRGHKATFFTKM